MNDSYIFSDDPILSKDEDEFQRENIVNEITEIIKNYNEQAGITIGIEGEWGSGKTSVINLILNNLNENWGVVNDYNVWRSFGNWFANKMPIHWLYASEYLDFYSNESKEIMSSYSKPSLNSNNGDKKDDYLNPPLIIFFNPWNYSNTGQILDDFFRSIYNAIKKENRSIASEFRKNASRYVPNIANTKTVEYGVSIPIDPTVLSAKVSKTIVQQPVYESKYLLNKTLQRLNKKILIIIDDIDRLDTDETLLIFKLTKIVANLSNMIFILAYDKEKTIRKLNQKFQTDQEHKIGGNYIDKIVQIPIPLPHIPYSDLQKYLDDNIINIRDIFGEKYWNDYRCGYNSFKVTLINILINPRHINRYLNIVNLTLKTIDTHNINLRDFLLLSLIRVIAFDVYLYIGNNKELFTYISYEGMFDNEKRLDKKFKAQEKELINIMNNYPIELKSKIYKIIKALFPVVSCIDSVDIYTDVKYLDSIKKLMSMNRKVPLRICLRDNFDAYFLNYNSLNPISNRILKELIQCLDISSLSFKNKVQALKDTSIKDVMDKTILAINNNQMYFNEVEQFQEKHWEKLFIGISDLLQDYTEDIITQNKLWINDIYHTEFKIAAMKLLSMIIKNIDNKGDFLCNYIKSHDGNYNPISSLYLINSQIGITGGLLLAESTINRLINEINLIPKSQIIQRIGDMREMLDTWSENRFIKQEKEFVEYLFKKDDNSLVILLAGFYIEGIGFNTPTLYKHVSKSDIDKAISSIDLDKLTSAQNKIIDEYKLAALKQK